jgi:hypothetical protein
VPRKQPTPKAAKPNLAELDLEDEEPSGLGILDDDGNMVLRRSAKPKPKGKPRGKKADKPAR